MVTLSTDFDPSFCVSDYKLDKKSYIATLQSSQFIRLPTVKSRKQLNGHNVNVAVEVLIKGKCVFIQRLKNDRFIWMGLVFTLQCVSALSPHVSLWIAVRLLPMCYAPVGPVCPFCDRCFPLGTLAARSLWFLKCC